MFLSKEGEGISSARVPWGLRDMFLAGLAAIAFIIVGGVVAFGGVILLSRLDASASIQKLQVLIILALEAVLLLPAWLWGPGKYGGGWASLGLRRFAVGKAMALGVGGLVLMLAMNAGWELIRQRLGLPGQPDYLPLFGGGLQGLALALGLGGVIAPVAEEVFFRGFVYAGLRARWGVGWGLILSGLVFALVHLIPGVLPPIFVMGVVFALIYEGTGSIWPCIGLHGAINSLAFVVAYLAARFPELAPLTR